jgi:hypothetical protein
LSDGPKPQKEIKEAADANCHAWGTIRRAQKELGIKPSKTGMTGVWTWSLPEGAHQNAKMFTPRRLDIFGEHAHLRGESEAIDDNSSNAVGDGWENEI